MAKLKSAVKLETAFAEYMVVEQLGEGGAGRVYGGTDDKGEKVAIKVLTQSSLERRKRFKNETYFLLRNKHPNIVTALDSGLAASGNITGPFYVMPRYAGNLRQSLDTKLHPSKVLPLFSQILDGVEAAHLQGITHRDLKPENVLLDAHGNAAIADFGIASFTSEQLMTLVETKPMQRLANFAYAAPEQRVRNGQVSASADIFALGLMLNEMFTGYVPHGTDYLPIAHVSKEYEYLDTIVSAMIRQTSTDRPGAIADVKRLIQQYQTEAVSLQRLSRIDNTVIRAAEVDEPLAIEPPRLVNAHWDGGELRLALDRPVTMDWINALHHMGNYSSVMGCEPTRFRFVDQTAIVPVREGSVQMVIDFFKAWLPQATIALKTQLQEKERQREARRKEELRQEREAEERRLRVNRSLRI